MFFALPDFIFLAGLVLGDELLGGAFGNDGTILQAYFSFGLDEFLTMLDDAGGYDQWLFNFDRLPEPDVDTGSQTGISRSIGHITHYLVQQAPQDTAMKKPGPSLMVFIRCKFGTESISVPGKLQLKPDGIIHTTSKAETFIKVGIKRYFWYGYHGLSPFLRLIIIVF
jgi:hypothetical protein